MSCSPAGGARACPSQGISLAIFAISVAVMAVLRLWLFRDRFIALTYGLPLLLCLWHRDRRLLWSMACAFTGMAFVKAFIIPDADARGGFVLLHWLMQVINIVTIASVVHIVINLTERLRAQNEELIARDEEISRQNEELRQQSEELAQQNEELQQQSEELGEQAEELEAQSEELRASNEELARRESLLHMMLESVGTQTGEKQTLDRICRSLLDLVGGAAAAVSVVERRGDALMIRSHVGLDGAADRAHSIEGTFAALVMEQDRTAFLEDLKLRPDIDALQPVSNPFRSVLASPLRFAGKPVGVLSVYSSDPTQWSVEQFHLVEWVALRCSLVLESLRLQEALAESRRVLGLALEAADMVTWQYTFADKVCECSQRAQRLYGLSTSRWVHDEEGIRAVVHPLDLEGMWQAVRAACDPAGNGRYHAEYRVRRPEGGWRWISAWGIVEREHDKPTRMIGSSRDITERKRSEQLSQAINSINEVIHSTLDFESVMQRAVTEAVSAMECESAAISLRKGDRWQLKYVEGFSKEVLGSEMTDEEERHALLAVNTRQVIPIDDAFNDDRVNPDHMRRWNVRSVLVAPLVTRDEAIGVFCFNYHQSPVSFQKFHIDFATKLAASLSLALENSTLFEEAESANRAKDRFLATLSHELRTPLTPVLMLSQQSEEDSSLPDEVREDMRTIRRNAQLEARLIDDLLDLTRIAHGKITLKPEAVDLHQLLQNAVQACCDEQFGERQLALEWQLTAGSSIVLADPARLEQVCWNLMHNAIKFTPPGGTITIRTRNPQNGRIQFQVIDTGKGIHPDKLATIFNPFEQGGRETTRSYGGLGLGLAVTKALTEMHGGTITACSDGPGKGATFTVEMVTADLAIPPAPVSDNAAFSAPAESVAAAASILLVEDHQSTLFVLQRLIRRWGWEVVPATSVRSALELAGSRSFDLVVSDLGLPDGTGYELMCELRDRYRLKGVALSGYGMEQDVQKSLASGFVAHLVKPVGLDELRNALMAFFAGAESAQLPRE